MSKPFDRFGYHQTLIGNLLLYCTAQPPFATAIADDDDSIFIQKLQHLSAFSAAQADFFILGQELIAFIVANYPHITPTINRDLFWYFGGSCLHYMSDDELLQFQQLEDLLYEKEQAGVDVDFNQLKAIAFQLH